MDILSLINTNAAVIICVLSVLAMLVTVGLAVLISVKRGAVRAVFDLAVTAVSFFAAAFAAAPIAGIITEKLPALFDADKPELKEIISAAVFVCASTIVFLAVFVVLQVAGGIIMASTAKKEKNKGFFRKKFKCGGLVAAAAGIISGMLIFTVICMPFKGAVSVASKSGRAVQYFTSEGSVQKKAAESVAILEKNPAKICSDIFGGRFATYQISKVKMSGKTISLQKETEKILDAAGDTFYALRDASDVSPEKRAKKIRKAKEKLETSEFIGIFGDRLIQLIPDKSGENEDGQTDSAKDNLLGKVKEVYGECDGEEIARSVGTVWEVLAVMTEKGYLNGQPIKLPTNDASDEEKDPLESVEKIADTISEKRGISDIMAILASDDRTRQLMSEIINSILPTTDEAELSMKDITVPEARELGTKIEDLIISLGKFSKNRKEYYKENGLPDDASLTPGQAADILSLEGAEELSNAISEMATDKYLGEVSEKSTLSFINETLGTDIEELPEEISYKNAIVTLRFSDAAEAFSDESRTAEEKKEKIDELVAAVSEDADSDYMSMIDIDMIMNALDITDPLCANNARDMLSTMFTELNNAEDSDGREKQAVSSALGVAFAGAGSERELFAEDGIAGTAEDFTDRIIHSEVMKKTLQETCRGDNNKAISDPVGFAKYISEEDKTELEYAVLTYWDTHELSASDNAALQNILLLFGLIGKST